MPLRIANREDPDQTADLGLYCFSGPFGDATSVQNFRTSILVECFCVQVWFLYCLASEKLPDPANFFAHDYAMPCYPFYL